MARIRADYVFGTTTNDPLQVVGTTLNSAELARLPAVTAPDVAAVTLHNGADYEIVHVTSHASSSTSATILRAQEGTVAQQWPSGTTWLHGLTSADTTDFGGGSSEFVGCKVKRTAAYTLTSGAVTAIPWDTEVYDTHGFHDNATNNTRLTIPAGQAGVYDIGGTWVPNVLIGAGVRTLCRILVNGSEVWGTEIEGGGVNASPSAVTDHPLNAGDYVEFGYYIGSGSPTLYTNGSGFFLKKVGVL